MKLLYVFDVSWLVYYGNASRQYKDVRINGLATGGTVFALANLLWALTRADKSTNTTSDVILCCDSPTDRKSILAGYKSGRVFNPEVHAQIQLLKYHADRLGAVWYEEPNMEADDMIYSACQHLQNAYDKIVVLSNDRDLAHNVNEKVSIDTCSPGGVCVSLSTYHDVFGGKIPYNSILASKVFMGDKSDGINVLRIAGIPSTRAFSTYVDAVREAFSVKAMFKLADKMVLLWYIQNALPPEVREQATARTDVIFPRLCDRLPLLLNLSTINMKYLASLSTLYRGLPYTDGLTKTPADRNDYAYITNLRSQVMDGSIALENNLPDLLAPEEDSFDLWG